MQGPAEVEPARVWLVGQVSVVYEVGSNLNIAPKRSCSVLECDIVMLPNYMLMM